MSAQVLGFVKCPICREMHYTEPVSDNELEEGAASNTQTHNSVVDVMATAWSQPQEQMQEVRTTKSHHQFVFRVNYALLSAIEHNLMHISAEDLTVAHAGMPSFNTHNLISINRVFSMHFHTEEEDIEENKMCKTLERKARLQHVRDGFK